MDDGTVDGMDDGRTNRWKISFHPDVCMEASFHPEASRP